MNPSEVPTAAASLLEQSWRLRYHDLDASTRLAQAVVEACAVEAEGGTATWARFILVANQTPLGPSTERRRALHAVERDFRRLGDDSGAVLARATDAVLRSMDGDGTAAWQVMLDDVAPHFERLEPDHQFLAAVSFTMVALGTKDLLAGLRYAYRALEIARQLGGVGPIALALFNIGYLHLNHGSFHEAIERFSEVMSLAQEHDLANRRRTTPPSLIVAHVALGDFDKAEALSARWMAEFGTGPLDNHVLYGRVMAIYLAARRRERWPQAEAWVQALEADIATRERAEGLGMIKGYLLHVAWAKAALYREQGRHEDAIAALEAAEPYDALCAVDFVHMSARDELQRALAALGRWPQAHAATLEFARRQASLLAGANAVRLQALAIQHAVERERLARQKAEESARLKSEFLANVSHEIRTPMNAIIGMAHLALRMPLAPAARDYVDKIHRAGRTLLGLLNDILDFSKIEAGKLSVQAEPFDLDDLVADVVTLTGHEASRKGLDWAVEVADPVPRRLRGDPLRLGQILINLVNNAIKFTDPGGAVRLTIRDEGEAEGTAALVFEVRDTGIGLSPAQLAQLFQPFVQADGSTSRRYGGTGLGLSISRRLAELMDGTITVDSALGTGSTFRLRVRLGLEPAAEGTQAAPTPAAIVERAEAAAATPAMRFDDVPDALRRHAGRRVLVVEDNAVNRQIAEELLRGAGLHVDTAEDGAGALACLRDAPPDHFGLVLMDLQMPGLDGHDTTRAIRAEARLSRLPIIALTAHGQSSVRERCVAEGMQDVVTKPLSPDALFDTVARWLASGATAPRGRAARKGAEPDPRERGLAETLAAALPGFETAAAIATLGGLASLYEQVLRQFAHDQAGAVEALHRRAAGGQVAEALRAAHTLKGLGATLGATRLHELAAEYEQGLRSAAGAAVDGAPAWPPVDPLADELASVLRRIAALDA